MSTKPATVPTFDSNGTDITPTPSGRITDGWADGDTVPATELNYWMMWVSRWCQYVSDGNFSRAEVEIFVPVPEFVSAGTDFAGTAKSLALTHLPVGSKITTIATSMKGPGSGLNSTPLGLSVFTVGGGSTPLGGPGVSIVTNTYQVTAPYTYNYTVLSGDTFVLTWASNAANLRGWVVKYIPPTAL